MNAVNQLLEAVRRDEEDDEADERRGHAASCPAAWADGADWPRAAARSAAKQLPPGFEALGAGMKRRRHAARGGGAQKQEEEGWEGYPPQTTLNL